MKKFFYSIFILVFIPFLILFLYLKFSNNLNLLDLERFSIYIKKKLELNIKHSILIHASSIGEVKIAQLVIIKLIEKGYYVILIYTTKMAKKTINILLKEKDFKKNKLLHRYSPYDFCIYWNIFVRMYKPYLLLLIEREVWHNMIFCFKKIYIPIIMINARMSLNSILQIKKFNCIFKEIYKNINFTISQNNIDNFRLEKIGIFSPKVLGNIKFELKIDLNNIKKGIFWRKKVKKINILFASIREGEFNYFLNFWKKIKKYFKFNKLLIFIPRHIQHINYYINNTKKSNINLKVRFSNDFFLPKKFIDIYICNTLGEILFFSLASDITIIGGSFLKFGSQNFIEPCFSQSPVIIGDSIYNFQNVANESIKKKIIYQLKFCNELWFFNIKKIEENLFFKIFWKDKNIFWLLNNKDTTKKTIKIANLFTKNINY